MADATDYLETVLRQVDDHKEALDKTSGCPPELIQCWVVLHNYVLTASKTIGFADNEATKGGWTQKEWQQTCKYILRDSLFVPVMSRIEYTFIVTCRSLPYIPPAIWMKEHKKDERSVYLKDLIREAGSAVKDQYLWEFAINFRNDVVHFNAIGRQSMVSPKTIDFFLFIWILVLKLPAISVL